MTHVAATPNPTPSGTPRAASPTRHAPNADLLASKMVAVSAQKEEPSSGSTVEVSVAISSFPPLPQSLKDPKALALPVGKSVHFSLSETISPGEFYVALDVNEKLGEDLMTYLEAAEEFPGVEDLDIGDFCIGKFSEDEAWYRARVIGMSIQDSDEGDDLKMLQLKFIDWGNEEDVPLSVDRVRQMPPSLMELPPLIYRCALVGVSPTGAAWDDAAAKYFSQFVEDPFSPDRAGVDLTIFATSSKGLADGAKGMTINEVRIDAKEHKSILAKKMIEKGLAQAPKHKREE